MSHESKINCYICFRNMQNFSKYRIAILGIGGVGGYIGGKLSKAYNNDPHIEIIFLARGENLLTIKKGGLKLITPDDEFETHPHLVSDDATEVGMVDLLICSVKAYDLVESIAAFKPCIGDDTIILPLVNGVDGNEKIRSILPHAIVLDGCIYLNSRLTEPGVIQQSGSIHTVYFGPATSHENEVKKIESVFKNAGIDAIIPPDIRQAVWEKFVFISAIATITSYANAPISEVLQSEENNSLLRLLAQEVIGVAGAKGISLPGNMIEKIMHRAASMPAGATSSMHSDFMNKKNTELDALTGYVVKKGKALNVPTPTYEKMFLELKNKSLSN